jgi:ABC-type multidrug transport system fused ATPase/permease subunit
MINLWQFKNFKNSITFINNQNLIAEAEVTEYWKARKDIDDFLSNHFYIMMGLIQEDQTHPLFWIVNIEKYKNISFDAINSHQQKLKNYLEKYVIILDNTTNYLSSKANNERISQEINKNINPLIDFLDNNLENFDSIKLPTNNQNTTKNFASDLQDEDFKKAREYYNNNKIKITMMIMKIKIKIKIIMMIILILILILIIIIIMIIIILIIIIIFLLIIILI